MSSLNMDQITNFLVGSLNTPSPTGYYPEAVAYTRQAFEALNLPDFDMHQTAKGALVGRWRGESSTAPRALTAHLDTLGMMVKEIKSSGRLKVDMIGGYDWQTVEFEGVTVRTYADQRYRGTFLLHNASAHVNAKLRTTERTQDTMEIRLDERVHSVADVRALGIEVGDFVFLDPRVEVSQSGFIRSRHLDDKASVACIYGALLAIREMGVRPAQDTIVHLSTYEEVGHGGTEGLPDDLAELVVVDMAAVGDGQASDEYSVTICLKDSSGAYHFDLSNKLRRIASAHEIAAKMDLYPGYSSDGSAYWRSGGKAPVALIGPGVESSHGYERTHQDAIDATSRLILHYLLDNA